MGKTLVRLIEASKRLDAAKKRQDKSWRSFTTARGKWGTALAVRDKIRQEWRETLDALGAAQREVLRCAECHGRALNRQKKRGKK